MRKIQLKLEALAVESFQTHAVPATRGTVQGNQEGVAVLAIPGLSLECWSDGCGRTEYYSCAVEWSMPASCQYGCDCTVKGSPC